MTHEQNDQIFRIMRRKAEDEKAAAARKFKLGLELMGRESDAHIAASAAATAAGATQAPKRVGMKEDDIIGEVPPEVTNISLSFAGLPQEEIVRIFHNRFKAINPHRLRHMRGLHYEAFRDQERTGIEGGMLRLRETSGTFEEFGKSFHEVWWKAFINYTAILVSLFAKQPPTSTLFSLNSTATSLSSPKSTSGRRPSSRWQLRYIRTS